MLDIRDLLNNKETYIDLLSRKGFDLNKVIKSLELNYKKYQSILKNEESKRELLNQVTNKIKLKRDSSIKEKESAKKLSFEIRELNNLKKNFKTKIDNILLDIPNIPNAKVIIGKNEKDNKIISTHLNDFKSKIKNNHPH